jgi:hypothetical protein
MFFLADSPFFHKITTQIIPAIAHLMKLEPLKMSRLAPEAVMMMAGKLDIDCTDLRGSDKFFQNFMLK